MSIQLIEQFWNRANDRDWQGFSSLLHHDLVYLVPQTRERIRGRAGFVDLFRTWPGPWRATVTQLIVDARHGVSTIDFETDHEVLTGITFFGFGDGLITSVTDYWPSPYEPPARATSCIERY